MRMQVRSLALLSGSGIQRCRELWSQTRLYSLMLRRPPRPALLALTDPLPWEHPYAVGVTLKKKKKEPDIVSVRMQILSLASLTELRIWRCSSCGIGWRFSSDLVFPWLWCRPAAVASIWPRQKTSKFWKKKKKKKLHPDKKPEDYQALIPSNVITVLTILTIVWFAWIWISHNWNYTVYSLLCLNFVLLMLCLCHSSCYYQ